MNAHFQLNAITNVLQAVCGCHDALTVYTHTHTLDLELWCVFSQEIMSQLKISCPLPKCSEVGVFCQNHFLFIYFFYLFPDPVSHHPQPPSQHFCPHNFRGRIWGGGSTVKDEYPSQPCDLPFCLLFSFFFSFFYTCLQPSSVWPDLHRTLHHASPHLKSPALRTCGWGSNKSVMPLITSHLTVDSAPLVIRG